MDNRTIGEKISSAYRPFLASKPVGPVDETVKALAKDIDRNFESMRLQLESTLIRLKDIEAIAADLYDIVEGEYPECDLQEMNSVQKYKKYKQITEIVDGAKHTSYSDIKTLEGDANNRQDKGTTG